MPSDFVPSSVKPVASVLVVGGGLVGQSIAMALQHHGIATTLTDPDGVGHGASWGNAGHIAVEQVEPLASRATVRTMPRRLFRRDGPLSLPLRDVVAWLPFSIRLLRATHPVRFAAGKIALASMLGQAMGAWERLLARLDAADLLRRDGHFVAWESPRTAEDGKRRWAAADIGTATIRDADADEMRRLQGLVGVPLAGAVRFLGSGQIADLGLLAATMASRFVAAGGVRRQAAVVALEIEGGRAVAVLDDGERIERDALIVAGGVRSGTLLAPLGHVVPLIAERGYHIQSAESDWPQDLPPVVFEDRAMIVTRFRSGLRAASFVEFGRADSPADRRKWAHLRRHVAALGLSFRLPGSQWMGARPTLPDYLPAIGRSRRANNLYYAFGHQHLGLTLAATTAEAIAALVTGAEPPFDLKPFDLERFGEAR